MPTNRLTGDAAVSRIGVSAGTIASSSGSASATPAPLRNVRRGMCIFLMNMFLFLSSNFLLLTSSFSVFDSLCAHLKLRTLHHAEQNRREAVVIFRRVAHDGAERRHVDVFHAAPEGVGHHFLGHHTHELRRVTEQRV